MAYYGRGWNADDTYFGYTGGTNNENVRATVFGNMPEHGWAWRMGSRLAVWYLDPGSADTILAVWAVDNNDEPQTRLGHTAEFNVPNEGSYHAECTPYTANITESTQAFSPSDNAIMLWSGTKYALGFSHEGNKLMHQQTKANILMYRQNSGSSTPPDPFVETVVTTEGQITVWVEYEPNVAPSKPTSGLAPTGSITDLTPNFTSNFNDNNSDRGDKINDYQIEMRSGSTSGTIKWNPTLSATNTEQNNEATAKTYNGSALSAGVTYYWKIRHSDQFGAWGEWSSWQSFTVNGGGSVAQPSGPTGKQETVQPTPFTAAWSHGSGLSTNLVEIRLKQGSNIVRGPKQISKSVANGGTISITWAETAFADLGWGQTYTVEIRARDTGSLFSPFSPARTFTTNAAPTIPYALSPSNAQPFSSYPKLSVVATDVDDTTVTGLGVECRIKSAAGAVLFTRTMTYNPTTQKFEYQTTGTDLAGYATYKWDARSFDGTLTSAYSPEATFVYGAGPAVTVTAPTEAQVLTTSSVTVTWTASGQVSYRVTIFAYETGLLVYDSGTTVSATQSHNVPSGYLFNSRNYYAIVEVTNSTPLTGYSSNRNFSISYTLPTGIDNAVASPISVAGDTDTSAVLLSWKAADDNPAVFVDYLITKKNLSTGKTVILSRITSIAQVTFVDYLPASGVTYEYGIAKTILQGSNEPVTSLFTTVSATVYLTHPYIVAASDGGTYRASLRLLKNFRIQPTDDTQFFGVWGDDAQTALSGPLDYDVYAGSFAIITDQYATAQRVKNDLEMLRKRRGVAVYRDERGEWIAGHLQVTYEYDVLGRYVVSIVVTQVAYREGVS